MKIGVCTLPVPHIRDRKEDKQQVIDNPLSELLVVRFSYLSDGLSLFQHNNVSSAVYLYVL